MNYQVVLQWPAFPNGDYDGMIEIEDVLIERLSVIHEVDGHDAGASEVNIFILTQRHDLAFDEVKLILKDHDCWKHIRIAYRDVREQEYVPLWPQGMTDFNVG